MNNPYEQHPETIANIYRTKSICPTIWKYDEEDVRPNGEVNHEAKKQEFWINDECAFGYCEYCYGHRYNEWFIDKPTEAEVMDLILKQKVKCELSKKHKKKKYNEIINSGMENNGQLITLCIDQNYLQIPKLCGDIIAEIKKADYSCISGATAVIEIHGSDGKINPHIHISTKKIKNAGQIAQLFRRKFVKPKYQVYRVDVKELPYHAANDYVAGHKAEASSDDIANDRSWGKMASVIKDREYREQNNLDHIYHL
jgi:hypothetical protein